MDDDEELSEDIDLPEEDDLIDLDPPFLEEDSSAIPENRVEIELEVGQFAVSLKEFAQMEPGYRLPIDIDPRIVRLIVDKKVIGKGEIMEIGEAIGVKILELYSP